MSFKVKLYEPQYIFARNTTEKLNLIAYDPLPLELSSSIGDNLTISSDGKYIVIGDNISRIRVFASLQFVSSSTSSQAMMIRRDREGTISTIATAIGYGTSITVEDALYIYVRKGDKLYVTSNKDSVINSADTGGVRSKLIVEKIC